MPYNDQMSPMLGMMPTYAQPAAQQQLPYGVQQPQQQMPAQPPMQDSARAYQYYMAMQRPDLAQAALQEANLPAPGTMDTIKSVLMGTPNSGLSGGAQMAQTAVPLLIGLYKRYMSNQQWANNPGVMQGVTNQQLNGMQNSFGLNRK